MLVHRHIQLNHVIIYQIMRSVRHNRTRLTVTHTLDANKHSTCSNSVYAKTCKNSWACFFCSNKLHHQFPYNDSIHIFVCMTDCYTLYGVRSEPFQHWSHTDPFKKWGYVPPSSYSSAAPGWKYRVRQGDNTVNFVGKQSRNQAYSTPTTNIYKPFAKSTHC